MKHALEGDLALLPLSGGPCASSAVIAAAVIAGGALFLAYRLEGLRASVPVETSFQLNSRPLHPLEVSSRAGWAQRYKVRMAIDRC